jgi:predicted Zn-dependent peptidase
MNSSNADAALEATLEIMKNIASNPPSGDELDKAKRYAAGQMRAGFDGPFALPRKIQFLLQRGFDEHYYTSYMDTLWSISSEEISQFADNYLQPEAFTIALAGKLN